MALQANGILLRTFKSLSDHFMPPDNSSDPCISRGVRLDVMMAMMMMMMMATNLRPLLSEHREGLVEILQ